jgi:predicted site-specific integrase-resolvase
MNELQQFRPSYVAKILSISIATFWRLVRDGKLKTSKLTPRTTTVSAKDLASFINGGSK